MAKGNGFAEPAAAHPLEPGDPVNAGSWRLVARLGAGGMGQVFLGVAADGTRAAVKVVHRELGRDPEFRRRFRDEVTAAASVLGPNTARVLGADPYAAMPWMATELIYGPSLADAVATSGPLPDPVAWQVTAGITEALAAIHRSGIIHRDLKPSNILLAADGPRVIDFGIARALERTSVTKSGIVIGTPGYMSPEQTLGAAVGPASDVFSLGCVVAFMTTGAAPFGDGSPNAVLYRVAHEEPTLASIPGDFRGLAARCLAKDPAERPSVAGIAAECARALGQGAPPAEHNAPMDAPHTVTVTWPPAVTGLIAARGAELRRSVWPGQSAHARSPASPSRWPAPASPRPSSAPQMPVSPPPSSDRRRRRRVPARMIPVAIVVLLAVGGYVVGEPWWAGHYHWPPKATAVWSPGAYLEPGFSLSGESLISAPMDVPSSLSEQMVTRNLVSGQDTGGADFPFNSGDTMTANADHHLVAVWDMQDGLKVFDYASGRQVVQANLDSVGDPGAAPSLAISADGSMVAGYLSEGLGNYVAAVWSIQTGRKIASATFPATTNNPGGIAFSPDGSLLAFYDANSVKLLEVATGAVTQVGSLPSSNNRNPLMSGSYNDDGDLTFSRDGREIAGGDLVMTVWGVATHRKIASFGNPIPQRIGGSGPPVVALSPDGRQIAYSNGVDVYVADVASGRQLAEWNFNESVLGPLIRHYASAIQLAFTPSGKSLVVDTTQREIVVVPAPRS